MFETMADELNDAGMYISKVIRADAPWNKDRIKELIWKPLQKMMLDKESTTQLTTKDIDEVFMVLNKTFGEMGVELQFPSIEQIINNQREYENQP